MVRSETLYPPAVARALEWNDGIGTQRLPTDRSLCKKALHMELAPLAPRPVRSELLGGFRAGSTVPLPPASPRLTARSRRPGAPVRLQSLDRGENACSATSFLETMTPMPTPPLLPSATPRSLVKSRRSHKQEQQDQWQHQQAVSSESVCPVAPKTMAAGLSTEAPAPRAAAALTTLASAPEADARSWRPQRKTVARSASEERPRPVFVPLLRQQQQELRPAPRPHAESPRPKIEVPPGCAAAAMARASTVYNAPVVPGLLPERRRRPRALQVPPQPQPQPQQSLQSRTRPGSVPLTPSATAEGDGEDVFSSVGGSVPTSPRQRLCPENDEDSTDVGEEWDVVSVEYLSDLEEEDCRDFTLAVQAHDVIGAMLVSAIEVHG